ncbi:MAG: class I SAM-dependent methyltransferase [Candidatus Hodarchaeota archaeon]
MEDLPKNLAASGASQIAQRVKSICGGKILDVGTENGDFIRTLMEALQDYESFIGIDIDQKEVEKAQKKFEKESVEIKVMNAEQMDFEDSSFDTVCISHSLHHLENINKVLSEMLRVLKPSGHFILQECYSDGEQTEAQNSDILQHHWLVKIDSLFGIPHHETLPRQRIKQLVTNLGLRSVEILESSHYMKCLFCDSKDDCEDPKNESMVEFIINEIDKNVGRLDDQFSPDFKEYPEIQHLKEEATELKKRIRQYGTANASHLFAIGRK